MQNVSIMYIYHIAMIMSRLQKVNNLYKVLLLEFFVHMKTCKKEYDLLFNTSPFCLCVNAPDKNLLYQKNSVNTPKVN